MIPLRDSRRPRRIAWATWCLLLGLFAGFLYQLHAPPGKDPVLQWGLIPARCTRPADLEDFLLGILSFFTAVLLHGSWFHLIGNLIFLAVFGNDLEDRLGKQRYLLFFLLAALASGSGEVATDPYSRVPRIGASGAISALLGAYLVAFPRTRIRGLLPLGCLWLPTQSPAWLYLVGWFLTQLLLAWLHLDEPPGGGIAWMAHLSGFLVGPVLLFGLDRKRRRWL